MNFVRRNHPLLAYLVVAALSGCAIEEEIREPPPRPADVRAQIVRLLPAGTADKQGWATDIYAALTALDIRPNAPNICAVLAIIDQESTFTVDPRVPNLGKIAWEEIDRRAERIGIPKLAVHLALKLNSPTGKSYAERLDTATTEKELSQIYEDFIGMVPLGERLFARLNPVRTGGPMQVSIAFAEKRVAKHPYPYPLTGSIRHEVFTRRGGLYFGIAHLLGYPASYDRHIYRFADFNAGHYASRNAGFQGAVSLVSGIPLDLDGDLIVRGGDAGKPGSTELAVRSIGRRLDLSHEAIRQALELDESAQFEQTGLYRRVFELADALARQRVPRAAIPQIKLHGPKITRRLTTEWFATRVEGRHRRCLAKDAPAPASGRR